MQSKKHYIGQETFDKWLPHAVDALYLQEKIVSYHKNLNKDQEKIFNDLMKKLQSNPFIAWLNKHQNFIDAKEKIKKLVWNPDSKVKKIRNGSEYIGKYSLEMLCVGLFTYCGCNLQPQYRRYLLKKNKNRLKKKLVHERKGLLSIINPANTPACIKETVNLMTDEIKKLDDEEFYMDNLNLFRTAMTHDCICMILSFYNNLHITQTCVADLTQLILGIFFSGSAPSTRHLNIATKKLMKNFQLKRLTDTYLN